MTKLQSLIFVFAFGLLRICHAQSNIVQTASFNSNNFSVNFSPINGVNDYPFYPVLSLPVRQFNPALGTLELVTLSFQFIWDATLTTGTNGGGGSISAEGDFYSNGTNIVYSNGNGTGNGGPTATNIFLTFTNADVSAGDNGLVDPAISTGTGSYTVSYQPEFDVDIQVGSVLHVSAGLASGFMTVTYTYIPAIPITNIMVAGGQFEFSFKALSGFTNSVQMKTNLLSPNWTTLTNIIGTGQTYQYSTAVSKTTPQFFRIKASN